MTSNISRALNKKLQRPYQLIGGDKVEVDGEIRPLSDFDISQELIEIEVLELSYKIKAECQRRIYSVASATDQMNLSALAGAGQFDDTQLSAFQDGLTWISGMRQAAGLLIANGDNDFVSDDKWPEPPASAIDLINSI